MIIIERNTDEYFTSIRTIANEVWPATYGSILSKAQFDFMMEMMYSISSLQLQESAKKHHFILAIEEGIPLGFASYEFNYNGTQQTKIHKLYVLTSQQGKGIGKKLVEFIENEAKQKHQESVGLNVNRFNDAKAFYEKLRFTIQHEEDIDIGNGYLMEDYVMAKQL